VSALGTLSTLHVLVGVAGEHYALPVDDVLEVAEYGEVAPVPGAPATVLGVRNLRGNVLAVLDMAVVFNIERAGSPQRIAVVEQEGRKAGLAVDSVIGVEHLPEASEEVESRYLTGAALTEGALIGVIDVRSVLDAAQRHLRRD
jgi:purine-binding chemotaxis protein CheW